jgi:hypothetical protein
VRQLVTVREISEIIPIDGADKIELVKVDGWQCVAKKGEFQPKNLCLYFEIDSILPEREVFAFMAPRKYRVKTIKCMKQISQGLAMPLMTLVDFGINPDSVSLGDDLTDALGVTKHDPEAQKEKEFTERYQKPKPWYYNIVIRIPFLRNFFKKKSGSFPTHICSKTDETRFQNLSPSLKQEFLKGVFEITEKIDGTSTTFIYRKQPWSFLNYFFGDDFTVCSRNNTMVHEDDSWWWSVAKKYDIKKKMEILYPFLCQSGEYMVWQGETISPRIQANRYKVDDYHFFLFNLMVTNGTKTRKYNWKEIETFLKAYQIDVDQVPFLGTFNTIGNMTIGAFDELFSSRPWDKKSRLHDTIAEGVVVRKINQNQNGLVSFKYVYPEYSLKNEE